MRKLLLTVLLASVLLCSSCSLGFYGEGDFFYISCSDAIMPVWVKGDESSDDLVIFLHGGPNDGAIQFALAGWPLIEDSCRMVWWDQRHAGQSQGSPDISETTMEDYTADLQLLLEVLQSRYDPDTITLLGTSWGSAVALAYLSDSAENRAQVDRFISLFGTHDFTMSYAAARDRMLTAAEGEALAFYSSHERIDTLEDFSRHMEYVIDAGGYTLEGSISHVDAEFSISYVFASPVALFPMLLTDLTADADAAFMERILTDDRLSEAGVLSAVDTPTLLLSGGKDLTAPKEVSEYIAGELIDAVHQVLPDSAHFSFGSASDLDMFNRYIAEFLGL